VPYGGLIEEELGEGFIVLARSFGKVEEGRLVYF
jgi:hypothetical protein